MTLRRAIRRSIGADRAHTRYRPGKRRRSPGTATKWLLGITAGLATSALINVARTRAAESANPPLGRFVTAKGVRLHYVEHGVGVDGSPPLVLIHGNGSMIQDFELSGIVAQLAERYRVFVFDRPGSGYSERPHGIEWTPERQSDLLVDAASSLGIVRPVVVGHSWGALVAAAWALDHPGKIGGVVLMSGYLFPVTRVDVLSQKPLTWPVLGDVVRTAISPILGRLMSPAGVRLIFAPAKPTAAFTNGFPFELALRPSQLRATFADTAQMTDAATRLAPRYPGLELPTTIIAGVGDKLVDFDDHSRRLSALLPYAGLVPVEGAGHMVHHIAPERVVAAIEELVESVGSAAADREAAPS